MYGFCYGFFLVIEIILGGHHNEIFCKLKKDRWIYTILFEICQRSPGKARQLGMAWFVRKVFCQVPQNKD